MFSIARASGASIPFIIGNRMEMLHPLRIKDLGAIENWLLESRLEVTADLVRATSDKAGRIKDSIEPVLAKYASVSIDDVRRYMETGPGITLSLWLCLRQSRSWNACCKVIERWNEAEVIHFVRVRDMISGIDILSDREWAFIPNKYRDFMDAEIDPEQQGYNWKFGFRQASDMGQCNFADIGELTIFQYQVLVTSDQQIKRIPQIPRSIIEAERKGIRPISGVPLRDRIKRPTKVPSPAEMQKGRRRGEKPKIGYAK